MTSGKTLPFTHLVIHHTGAEEKDTDQIRRYHLSKGWQDVGYHFVIERDGKVAAGRKLSTTGAHCQADGMNRKAVGIALIGNFEKNHPSFHQIKSLLELMKKLTKELKILPKNILLHNQVQGANTLCPGKNFPKLILSVDVLQTILKNA
ncbi:MAG: N-acetylmuramoyl-L-alanine amidase [Clostridia bacterium]|jgi:N-acetyl-anhydromuramyl-L-alanine amidase AmpD|nr:N-acetylmuramoyl-L-alanine amidase [Clostridia bacterium]